MPNIQDATVVASAYDTSGNGGRKLVRLKNGTQFAAMKSGGIFYIYKTTDNWATSTLFKSATWTSLQDIALATDGINLFVLQSVNNNKTYFGAYKEDGTVLSGSSDFDINQSAMGNVSIAINETGTELHAALASKNSTYPNSFNIRYAKGTINADGSVTWGAVEQVSTINTSGYNCSNPSIVFANGYPFIFADIFNPVTAHYGIIIFTTKYTTKDVNFTSSWGNKFVYDSNSNTYTQSSPSACVDKNGRIWVAWHGKDSTYTVENIRVAYSDDGGVTWSSMTKLTSGNSYHQMNPSITASKNNEIFILWNGQIDNVYHKAIKKIKYSNSSWGSVTNVITATGNFNLYNPSTLYDLSVNFSEPLFIYKNEQSNKVGFYGTWTVTNISVTQGYIGQKTSADKSNILTYSITTDGTMSDITEEINGTTIATRTNPTSGQQFTVSLTQEQWDAVRFGKYVDIFAFKDEISSDWEQGFVTSWNPLLLGASTTRIRTKSLRKVNPNTTYQVSISGSFEIIIGMYDESQSTYQANTLYLRDGQTFTTTINTHYVFAVVKKYDESPILPSEIEVANIVLSGYSDNTLTIEMGSDTWTYTFDKRLNANDDILSAVKGVQDLQTHFNGIKSQLGAAIRAKGGTVNDTDAWSAFVSAIDNIIPGRKFVTGNFTPSGSSVSIRGLMFTPSVIIVKLGNQRWFAEKFLMTDGTYNRTFAYLDGKGSSNFYSDVLNWYSDGFDATSVFLSGQTYQFYAIE
ncbi:exo-alpha-sialidase [Neobacillus sp. YIM B02564]|uniref:Exo-alpha-sialidase n=1 Tax=Neobacillus paridis TaxID=2803862 RepID=A0ABS1TIH3_9BACI|nr:sialidase family protein [Neobacillus paridis]MBL4950973.1 exo-alpha-sialidase [Neobacillus paridis]